MRFKRHCACIFWDFHLFVYVPMYSSLLGHLMPCFPFLLIATMGMLLYSLPGIPFQSGRCKD